MPIITISRGSLSGGKALAKSLGERLGIKVISREVIIEAAKEFHISEEDLVKGLNSPPGFWERLMGQKEHYTLAIQAALADLVEDGDAIYHGLAGHLLLHDVPHVLKVRLIAPLESRIRSAMSEHSLSREQALAHIETKDHERELWVRHIYNAEWSDPSLYDVVVNLEHMTIATATELIVNLLEREEFKTTPESKQAVADFALATHVRAALKFNSSFHEDALSISANKGVVHLMGGPFSAKMRAEVTKFIKGVPGVKDVTPKDDDVAAASSISTSKGGTARDLMIPLSRYPHIHDNVSIREAMMALGASSVVLMDGHMVTPRYVLVLDQHGRLNGVIGRRNLLQGLSPQFRAIEQARKSVQGMTFAPDPMPVTLGWDTLFSEQAIASSWEPVKTIMAPIRGTVRIDDSLSTVVTTMLHHAIDLVPVLEGDYAVGVILMTDVFDTVGEHILEMGAPKPL
ncbi:MAG: hypothetical protein A2289_25135 [Deltaproteobacteria bacterium RIFOXYA12_FULL_58_15]|nr:MAG: hypothetical protein A2289_25135 [Deltaproteobacteria bacterium RIFOXYA12_FULL_58_15]OGR13309.1 MAG: hypothetical protein A2341_16245 [Deltaproteobacteria bacterium RIFOXYB12_FULL_58_9]